MSLARSVALPAAARRAARPRGGVPLGWGVASGYLSLIVLIPLAAVALRAGQGGPVAFWRAVSSPQSLAALGLTLGAAFVVVAINVLSGTLIAWVLVRDSFPGKSLVNAVIDLPFALPTIVAGLTLMALYGPQGPLGLNIAYTRAGVLLALLFVTLPFVVRAVQPVLLELDREMEEAAASLGAGEGLIFRQIILPNLVPAIVSGAALAFARAMGEFGSVVLLSGNVPFSTEVASVHIFSQIESDSPTAAASLSVVLLALSFAILMLLNRLQRRGGRP